MAQFPFTVSVWNIKPSVTAPRLEEHFGELFPKSRPRPKVYPLIPSEDLGFQTTIVTLCLPGDDAATQAEALQKLKETALIVEDDGRQEVSKLVASAKFEGVTFLAQSHPEPAFE